MFPIVEPSLANSRLSCPATKLAEMATIALESVAASGFAVIRPESTTTGDGGVLFPSRKAVEPPLVVTEGGSSTGATVRMTEFVPVKAPPVPVLPPSSMITVRKTFV